MDAIIFLFCCFAIAVPVSQSRRRRLLAVSVVLVVVLLRRELPQPHNFCMNKEIYWAPAYSWPEGPGSGYLTSAAASNRGATFDSGDAGDNAIHFGLVGVADRSPARRFEDVEQQERYSRYSQQALGFAIPLFSGYLASGSATSPTDTVVKLAVAPAFFVAITADLISWRMKPKWGRALVYISSSQLLLMTCLIFVSFDDDYGYAVLFLPLMLAATLLLRNLWAGVRRRKNTDEEVVTQDLDFMFDFSAFILNCDSIITMIIAIGGHLTSSPSKYYMAASAAGFLFFFTVVLSLYLMMVATVRSVALTIHAKYLDVLLMVLVVSTLIANSITLVCFRDEELEGKVPT